MSEQQITYEEVSGKLRQLGEEHLLRYYDELSSLEQDDLLKQIASTDFSYLARFAEKDAPCTRGVLTPLAAMTLSEIAEQEKDLFDTGLAALKEGRAAAVCLAGGMGTRLGFDGPKGVYDIGLTRPVYIFQRLIENLLQQVRLCGKWIYLFFMTSDGNDEATQRFLREHNYFGYDEAYIRFFKQEMAPAVDQAGHVLLADRSHLALSPNGNGGWYQSLIKAGLVDLLQSEGVDYLNVFGVDNVLQNICDPLFLGAVLRKNCAAGSKVVRKNSPDERVGVMCLEDGRTSVVEYYEMTEAMRQETDEKGERVYNFGVINNHLFHLPSLLKAASASLPLHFASKKVPCLDEKGEPFTPEAPNGWKFEYFIFDIFSSLPSCLPFEVERHREFAPIKNAVGADSVESARALCLENGIPL